METYKPILWLTQGKCNKFVCVPLEKYSYIYDWIPQRHLSSKPLTASALRTLAVMVENQFQTKEKDDRNHKFVAY